MKDIPTWERERGKLLTENQLKRLAIIDKYRKLSNHSNNINVKNAEAFVPCRWPNGFKIISEYRPCPKCKDWYSKSGIRKHVRKCTNKFFKRSHAIDSMSKLCVGNFHKVANEKLIMELSDLNADEVLRDFC